MLPIGEKLPVLKKQQGAVAVIVALSMVGLIGFVGLALDLGKLFVAKTELQNSVDACALAAAYELTGANSKQLILAEAAGIATGQQHHVMFQGEAISISRVSFAVELDGEYRAASEISPAEAVEMRFARCEANRTDILNWFIQVLNLLPGVEIGSQTVAASAVASPQPGQTVCAIPVGFCSDDVPPSTPVGTWLESVLGPPAGGKKGETGNLTGNFMWIDYSPPGGGASELADQLTHRGVCSLPVEGSQVGEAGVKSSLANDWNSRFGINQGNVKEGDAIPDRSGYAYTEVNWPSKFNALSDFQSKRGSNTPYQGDASTGLKIKGSISDTAYLNENGKNRRLATVAVVDCDSLISGTTAPVQAWACVLMLHPINNSQGGVGTGATRMYLEYLGRSSDTGSPCISDGVPAGPTGKGPMVPTLVR